MQIKVRKTFIKRRKKWVLRWEDPDGSTKQRDAKEQTKERLIEEEALELQEFLNQGYDYTSTDWAQFCQRYEEEKLEYGSEDNLKQWGCAKKKFNALTPVGDIKDVNENVIATFTAKMRKKGYPVNTIHAYLRQIRAAIRWAKKRKIIQSCPEFDMPTLSKKAKGRPIVQEEFERLYLKMFGDKPDDDREEYEVLQMKFMDGLWLSGMRLKDFMGLSFDHDAPISIRNLDSKDPTVFVKEGASKSSRYSNKEFPLAPRFVLLLRSFDQREGIAFPFPGQHSEQMIKTTISKKISKAGKDAGIKVSEEKFASAHDMRRGFGAYWATNGIETAVLKELMWHASIDTTLTYYATNMAQQMSRAAWDAESRRELTS